MINTEKSFYGQQEGEKILYTCKPHFISEFFNIIKIFLVATLIFVIFFLLAGSIETFSVAFRLIGVIISISVILIGTNIVKNFQKRNISYITDRRVIRFDPTTLFATNTRSLTWDEVVKVKTFPPNMLWKQLKIGNVIVHARTSVKTVDESKTQTLSADDIELNDIYLYRDLGNYIDKILFTYKQMPQGVTDIKPFVAKPKGQRY